MKASFYHVFDPEAELARWDWIHSPAELRCYSIRLSSVPHAVASIVREEGAALGLTSGRLRSANGTVNAKSEMLVQGTEKSLKELSEKLKRSGGEAAACGESILGLLRRARRRLPGLLQLGRHRLPLGKRTLIMGILNLTPDSFSDGGSEVNVSSGRDNGRRGLTVSRNKGCDGNANSCLILIKAVRDLPMLQQQGVLALQIATRIFRAGSLVCLLVLGVL